MVDFLGQLAWQAWLILKEASIFLLLGFFLAGLLAVLVPSGLLMRLLGRGKVRSVLWGAGIGIPIPFCSCAVLPTTLALLRQGATRGAAVSFLISTPETGLDTIALSYALMDPIITVWRPVSAVITALVAGIATNLWGTRQPTPSEVGPSAGGSAEAPAADAGDAQPSRVTPQTEAGGPLPVADVSLPRQPSRLARVKQIFDYGFRELLDAMAHWLVLGILLSALVAVLLPASVIERYLGGGFTTMLAAFVLGIPIYGCASASTPIAAALVLKGLSPGAALVFLLSGPATNLGALVVLLKFLGRRVVAIYLITVAVLTILSGYALDWIYRAWHVNPSATFGRAGEFAPEWLQAGGAVLLIGLLVLSLRRAPVPDEWLRVRSRFTTLTGGRLSGARLGVVGTGVLLALYLGSGFFSVQPGEIALKTRFGRVVAADLGPGLHYRWPWPIEEHRVIQLDRIRRIEVGFRTVATPATAIPATKPVGFWDQRERVPDEALLLTGDENLIDVAFSVQYRIEDPLAYAYVIADADAVTRGVSISALRAILATMNVDEVYASARQEIERRVLRNAQELLDAYRAGLRLVAVNLLSVHAPGEVHAAFRDVASAQEDMIQIIDRANTFAQETVNLAEGDAAAMIESAQAFREQRILEAEGDAAGFDLVEREYQRAPDLTRLRLYLETVEQVLPGTQKILRPGAGDLKDFDLWMLQPVGPRRGP